MRLSIVDLHGTRGFHVIAITDHVCETNSFIGLAAHWLNRSLTKETFNEYIFELEMQASRAWKQYRMLLLPGIEITKNTLRTQRSAHILGIGVRQWVDPDENIENILKSIKGQGAITIAAHPVFTMDITYIPTLQLWKERDVIGHLIDAWEVASGAQLFEEVFHSGLPMLANSDLHHQKQIRSWKTLIKSKRTETSVLKSICNQDISFAFYNGESLANDFYLTSLLSIKNKDLKERKNHSYG